MAIIRWDPFRDLVTLRERMNRLFEDAFTSRGEEKDMVASSWSPSVGIYETENEIVLTAEVPGVDEKNIEIKLEDNTLALKGERNFEKETKEENYHRIERAYGSFYRSFTLPRNIDQD
ncbi:MAG: Hsp20/alpha crystallin family protein, partial [Candidatus Aminicenantes bacterium]|nr:Hsp20/alpha crystallin family protein [Candidatus Aminicenantes bacterium]